MEYQEPSESFLGKASGSSKGDTGKDSFLRCHCCTWTRDLEQWQPSYSHEDFYLKARLPH